MAQNRVIGTVTSVKGKCSWGHEVGDTFELSGHNTAGLCGYFYHDLFPAITMLEFGGQYPWGDPDKVVRECIDKTNTVTIELRRER